MNQPNAYEREPYRTTFKVEVTATGETDGRPYAILDDTICYPEGGGQPADRGRLGKAAILDVQRQDGVIRHHLNTAVATGPTTLELDWPRRYDHMQQHTAQHLLTAVAADRFGWPTVSFHLHGEISDIEVDAPALSPDDLNALEEAVAAEIRANRPVTARRVSPKDYAALEVRSRGLPAGHSGDIRLVEIEGLDLNTCGGTHLVSIGEIEALKLLGVESLRGGTRLHWVAGSRVRRRLAAHEARNAELRKLLGAGDDDLLAIAQLKLEQLKTATRRQKFLEKRLAEAATDNLLALSTSVVEAHFDDTEMGFLQQIAQRFSRSDSTSVALLTADGAGGCAFVLVAGGGADVDLPPMGRQVAERLGGRGGGSGRIFQGKAESLAGRDLALTDMRAGSG